MSRESHPLRTQAGVKADTCT